MAMRVNLGKMIEGLYIQGSRLKAAGRVFNGGKF
jgi:hypothetical protein